MIQRKKKEKEKRDKPWLRIHHIKGKKRPIKTKTKKEKKEKEKEKKIGAKFEDGSGAKLRCGVSET